MVAELNPSARFENEFVGLFEQVSVDSQAWRYKRVACVLFSLRRRDRNWILAQLPEEEQQRIAVEIESLQRLGLRIETEMARKLLARKSAAQQSPDSPVEQQKDIASIALIAASNGEYRIDSSQLEQASINRITELCQKWQVSLPIALKRSISQIGG